jgi:hypothetical protein
MTPYLEENPYTLSGTLTTVPFAGGKTRPTIGPAESASMPM